MKTLTLAPILAVLILCPTLNAQDCDESIPELSGELDSFDRCKGNPNGNWACVEKLTRTCKNPGDAGVQITSVDRFTGRCERSLNDCYKAKLKKADTTKDGLSKEAAEAKVLQGSSGGLNVDACEVLTSRKSPTIDSSKCSDHQRRWACYEDQTKRCVNTSTKKERNVNERKFTGKCASSPTEC